MSQSNRSPLETAEASARENGGTRCGSGASGRRQIHPISAHGDHLRLERSSFAVKNLDHVADTEPADSAQVPGFVAFQSNPGAGGRSGQ